MPILIFIARQVASTLAVGQSALAKRLTSVRHLSIIRRRSVYEGGSAMEDSLLDGIDVSPRFVEGTKGLSLTELVSSVVCGVAGGL